MIIKDFYKLDVFRFDIESSTQEVPNEILFNKDGTIKDGPCTKHITTFDIEISNVISWDTLKIKMTRDELIGLSRFIDTFLKEND